MCSDFFERPVKVPPNWWTNLNNILQICLRCEWNLERWFFSCGHWGTRKLHASEIHARRLDAKEKNVKNDNVVLSIADGTEILFGKFTKFDNPFWGSSNLRRAKISVKNLTEARININQQKPKISLKLSTTSGQARKTSLVVIMLHLEFSSSCRKKNHSHCRSSILTWPRQLTEFWMRSKYAYQSFLECWWRSHFVRFVDKIDDAHIVKWETCKICVLRGAPEENPSNNQTGLFVFWHVERARRARLGCWEDKVRHCSKTEKNLIHRSARQRIQRYHSQRQAMLCKMETRKRYKELLMKS